MTHNQDSTKGEQNGATPVDFDPFACGEVVRKVPATEPQQEIWTATHMDASAACAFNAPLLLHLKGRVQYPQLLAAYSQLIERHDALRGSFSPDGRDFVITANVPLDLPLIDLSLRDAGSKDDALIEILEQDAMTAFNLEFGPLIRGQLIKFDEADYFLLITVHHIVCDGWSTGILLSELAELYSAETGKRQPSLQAAPSFADYARELHVTHSSESYLASKNYWLAQFADEPPVLYLPLDKPRPPVRTFNGSRRDCFIDTERTQALAQLAAQSGNTLFVTLFAIFQILLWKRSGQPDIVVGFPAAAQPITDNAGLIGHCVNLLPIRFKLDDQKSFTEHLDVLRPHIYDALEYQEFTFGSLLRELQIERDSSRVPLVPVTFNLEKSTDEFNFEEIKANFSFEGRSNETFEISLNVVNHLDKLELQWSYNTDLFAREGIDRLIEYFLFVLNEIIVDPYARISTLPLISPQERQLIRSWNATEKEYPLDQCLHHLFEAQVARTPEAIAVEYDEQTLTYKQLEERANQLACHLQVLGVAREQLVGVFMERSMEMVIALWGILKAGGAYVPLDPDYPPERIAYMLEDTGALVLLTQAQLKEQLPRHKAKVVCLDQDWDVIARHSPARLSDASSSNCLAYVIYTSGSTGKPKGVMNNHSGVVNLLLWTQETFQLSTADRILQTTPFSFDASIWELFWPLTAGARLVIAKPGRHMDPAYLAAAMVESEITTVQFVPSMLGLFLEYEHNLEDWSVRQVFCGGEVLSKEIQDRFFERFKNTALYNVYGPTEAAVDVTHWACERGTKLTAVPIGKPHANTQCYILDKGLQLVPPGVPGELHIGGVQVARGYLNRDDLTAQNFIRDPFSDNPHARIYKTGDMVRYRVDGNIEYVGRSDSQVKVRGLRIELGEIESVLLQHTAVSQCTVTVREERVGDQRLIAYVVLIPGAELTNTEMREHARTHLPDYMVPQHVVELDALPLTPNGKVDLKALPVPEMHEADHAVFKAPDSELEIYLTKLWTETLMTENIGVADNFFELGGHSLLAIHIVTKLSKDLETEIPLPLIFEYPCISDMAQAVEKLLVEELDKLSDSEAESLQNNAST